MRVRCRGGMAWLSLFVLLGTAVGCGESGVERAEVQGNVTFDGTPVESGTISFIPIEGTQGPSAGGAITDGSYHIPPDKGPVIGKHRVQIVGTRKTGKQMKAGPEAEDPNAIIDEIEMFIPPEYNTRSELTVDVEPGTNEFDFDLEPTGN